MKKLLIMLVLVVLLVTALQGAILVWFYEVNQTLFWTSVVLLAATTAVFIYFMFRADGIKGSMKYLWDYWFLTSK